jgi:hypothetical protein
MPYIAQRPGQRLDGALAFSGVGLSMVDFGLTGKSRPPPERVPRALESVTGLYVFTLERPVGSD